MVGVPLGKKVFSPHGLQHSLAWHGLYRTSRQRPNKSILSPLQVEQASCIILFRVLSLFLYKENWDNIYRVKSNNFLEDCHILLI